MPQYDSKALEKIISSHYDHDLTSEDQRAVRGAIDTLSKHLVYGTSIGFAAGSLIALRGRGSLFRGLAISRSIPHGEPQKSAVAKWGLVGLWGLVGGGVGFGTGSAMGQVSADRVLQQGNYPRINRALRRTFEDINEELARQQPGGVGNRSTLSKVSEDAKLRTSANVDETLLRSKKGWDGLEEQVGKQFGSAEDKAKEGWQEAKDRGYEIVDGIQRKGGDVRSQAGNTVEDLRRKGQDARYQAENTVEDLRRKGQDATSQAEDKFDEVKNKSRSSSGSSSWWPFGGGSSSSDSNSIEGHAPASSHVSSAVASADKGVQNLQAKVSSATERARDSGERASQEAKDEAKRGWEKVASGDQVGGLREAGREARDETKEKAEEGKKKGWSLW